ncbi:unnamed protein product [Ilex paraguariensis]|uniref:Bifunctional inhibitor/plant lipid transfer protein/seed storage helical domain-containing protein n=1 Tax=Ilex paraguariensis TaxID=185542 RepID=A0ABC8S1I4_9AQUA
MEMVLTLVLVTALWTGSMAQQSCTSVIISLSPCLDYITGNSSTPSSACCTQLANAVRSQPECLCEIINGTISSLGISINQTQAMALPNACNVQTPPVSRCNASSPVGSPAGTPGSPSTPSGSGSKTIPSPGGVSSDGYSTKLPFALLLSLLSITSYASTFIAI